MLFGAEATKINASPENSLVQSWSLFTLFLANFKLLVEQRLTSNENQCKWCES